MNVWWDSNSDLEEKKNLHEEEVWLANYICLVIQIVIKGMLWNINIKISM